MGYIQTVDDIAKEALDEYPDDEDGRNEYITQTVDGSEYVIYYSKNEEVLQQTRNEPDDDEIAGMCGPNTGWRQMREIAAYMAMEADVNQEVARLVEEREEVTA